MEESTKWVATNKLPEQQSRCIIGFATPFIFEIKSIRIIVIPRSNSWENPFIQNKLIPYFNYSMLIAVVIEKLVRFDFPITNGNTIINGPAAPL